MFSRPFAQNIDTIYSQRLYCFWRLKKDKFDMTTTKKHLQTEISHMLSYLNGQSVYCEKNVFEEIPH